jgi:hypothetical protein
VSVHTCIISTAAFVPERMRHPHDNTCMRWWGALHPPTVGWWVLHNFCVWVHAAVVDCTVVLLLLCKGWWGV